MTDRISCSRLQHGVSPGQENIVADYVDPKSDLLKWFCFQQRVVLLPI